MIKRYLLLFVLLCAPVGVMANEDQPELNVIYGKHHLFTVETPKGWVNDKKLASTINLVSFFYPIIESREEKKNYMYAMGYDKERKDETLQDFVKEDLKIFKKSHPKLSYKIIKSGHTGAVIDAVIYSFDHLSDKYKEEVAYLETNTTFIVFAFGVHTEDAYKRYGPVFDRFLNTFTYRGNDPKLFLQWQKEHAFEMIKEGMEKSTVHTILGVSLDTDKDISGRVKQEIVNALQHTKNNNAVEFFIWEKAEHYFFLVGFDAKGLVAVYHTMLFANGTQH